MKRHLVANCLEGRYDYSVGSLRIEKPIFWQGGAIDCSFNEFIALLPVAVGASKRSVIADACVRRADSPCQRQPES